MKKVMVSLLLVVALAAGLWQLSKARSFQLFGDIVSQVETSEKLIALTFDDGPWNADITDQVLDTLNQHQVKATFYLNGKGMASNPNATSSIIGHGHEIGNHSYSHDRLVFKTPTEIAYEIETTNQLIRSAGYEGDITFRPPYGKKLFVLPHYLSQQDIVTVMWSIEPETYSEINKSSESIAEFVIEQSKPGAIILLHVLGSKNTHARDALPSIIDGLKQDGFEFVTVSELLEKKS
ncbi:polysaccharide deacetylase family protein [Vibrio ulleungensis]